MTVRTDVITIGRHMAKHICVLIQMCFDWQNICVFNLWGLFVEYTFRRTLIIS